jgi:hypothetical protein
MISVERKNLRTELTNKSILRVFLCLHICYDMIYIYI